MWPLMHDMHLGENIAISYACRFGDVCVLRNLEHVVLGLPSSDILDGDFLSVGFTYDVNCDNGGNF